MIKQFVNNKKVYFDKVFDLTKTGTNMQDAYDIVEAEYRQQVGRPKFKSFESFRQTYYAFWRSVENRK